MTRMPPAKRLEVDVDGRTLSLSNLDKPMYPAVGFTKGHVIDYYTRVAPYVLPHLEGRPLTFKRYPNGVEGQFFYEKNVPSHRPAWVHTADVRLKGGDTITFCLCDDLPTLVWLAQLADLELHPSLSKAASMPHPTVLAFDLDPGPPATIVECCAVALELRELFAQLGLECFAKTSGSKGMQVYVPLNSGIATYDETKPFARSVAMLLERRDPKRVVSEMTKAKRVGKVFVDWSQNDQIKTTVGVYSLRARERPTVSTPLRWEEVEACTEAEQLAFTADAVLERCAAHGDLFDGVVTMRQELPKLG